MATDADKEKVDSVNLKSTERDEELPARKDNYQEPQKSFDTRTLLVEGEKLFVIKDLLAAASPFFKILFGEMFKEGHQDEIELPGKKFESMVWLLDYLYPNIRFHMTDARAVALLSLADEYQLPLLTEDCVSMLEKVTPRLELVTLAAKYNLKEYLESSMNDCVEKIHYEELNRQRKLEENKTLDPELFIEMFRRKLVKLHQSSTSPVYSVHSSSPFSASSFGAQFTNTVASPKSRTNYKAYK